MDTIRTIRAAALASAVLFLMSACDGNSALPTEDQAALASGPALRSALPDQNPELAQQLAALKQLSAKYHDLDQALDDYPVLVVNELVAPDGCISDATEGGMGYHYAGAYAIDDAVNYLEPELLVYAPTNGAHTAPDGSPRFRLAAFDYFIPYSDAWPQDGAAPTSEDLGLAIFPPIPFAQSRFGGWMFHIWPWENNPAGLFANWNPAVPLCEDSPY